MASSIELRSLANVITNLNADLAVTSSAPQVTDTCGTYALINQMITDLSTLKATLKTAEKDIEATIRTELELSTNQNTATNTMVIQTAIPSTCGVATKTVTSDALYLNSADATAVLTARKENDTNINTNIGIKLNGTALTESAILNGLAEAYGIINTLKNGQQLVVTEGTNT